MERKQGENFDDYKVRRAIENANLKVLRQGTVFWDSMYQGTYINHEKRAKRAAKGKQ